MKKQLFSIFFLIFILILGIYPFSVSGTISKAAPGSFTIGDGDTISAFYAINPQSSSIFYAPNCDRYFAVYPEYTQAYGTLYAFGAKSAEGDYKTWSEEGMINNEGIVSGSHIGEYPSSAHMTGIYSNDSDCIFSGFARVTAVQRSYIQRGNVSDAGVLTWGYRRMVSGNLYGGHYDIAVDASGYPMLAISAQNSSNGNAFETTVFFMNTSNPLADYQCDTASVDSLPNGERFSTIIPLNETAACYLIEGDSENANPLYGGYMDNTTSNWGSFSNITNNNVKFWADTNNVRFMDWSASYDDYYAHVCYVDTNYDLWYFTIDLNDYSKSTETLVYNGTASLHPFQPSITVSEYTPAIFFWEKESSASTVMWGLAVEKDEEGDWTADNPVNVTSKTWGTTNYILAGICRETFSNTSIAGYYEGIGTFTGTDFNFTGYGLDEDYFTLTADLEDIDDDGADWVFTDWKYYNFSFETNMNPVNVSLQFTVPLGAENVAGGFFTDGENWTYASNMTYEMREGEPFRLQSDTWNFDDEENITTGSFLIWFENIILDVWNDVVDVYYSVNASAYVDSGVDFRIYSKGGYEMNFETGGYTAGKVSSGGTPFDLYAANGSWAYNEIWYRDAQHIKLMPDIHFLTGYDEFYVRYGCDYSLGEGEWLEGWAVYINPKTVSYTGIFAGNVWINMTNIWYNRGSSIDYEDLYMFYHGSVSGSGDPGHFKVWVDLWFSDKNASSVCAARVNAYEFPMIDTADLWLRWLANNWGVKDDVLKEMSMSAPLLDSDNSTVISSERIKMVRYWCMLEVADAGGGQWVYIEPYESFDVTHSRELPLTGVSDPVFDETLIPTVNQRGILGALWTMFAGLAQWLSEDVIFGGLGLWDTFVGFLDTIAGLFGAPSFFSDLFAWLAELFGYLAVSAGHVITILGDIFELIGALMVTFLVTMGDIITALVNTFTMIGEMLGGAYGAGVNIWEMLGLSTWITLAIIFYPIYLIILWDEKGMDAVIQQLTWMFGLLTWVFNFLISVIQFTLHLIERIIESIPVVE